MTYPMTAEELVAHYGGLDTDERIKFMGRVVESNEAAHQCWGCDHVGSVQWLQESLDKLHEENQKLVRRAARHEADLIAEMTAHMTTKRELLAAQGLAKHESEGRQMFLALWREERAANPINLVAVEDADFTFATDSTP